MARDREDKYVRLTGLWESKKRGLFSGKLREQDIEKLVEKIDEAKDAGSDLIFFLWENNDKRGRKDPRLHVASCSGRRRCGGWWTRVLRARSRPRSATSS